MNHQQLFLDPRSDPDPEAEELIPPGPIPEEVRKFGRFPDLVQFLPGDLVLVSNLRPTKNHHVIEWVQRKGGYSQEDARWHHAAVYLGNGDICEADLDGVGCRAIYRYVKGHHLIRVRRDSDLTSDERWKIAIRSLTRLRQAYAFSYLPELLWMSLSGFWKQPEKPGQLPKRAKICSQLYVDAYSPVTQRVLVNTASGEITPAFLSSTDRLVDIPIRWLKIRKYDGR